VDNLIDLNQRFGAFSCIEDWIEGSEAQRFSSNDHVELRTSAPTFTKAKKEIIAAQAIGIKQENHQGRSGDRPRCL
jgi:hypothetical protein